MKTCRMFLIALCGMAMLIGADSCKKEKPQSENVGEEMTINASLNSADGNSKTHLNGPKVCWDNTDAFKLFQKGTMNGTRFKYDHQVDVDGTKALFVGTRPGTKPFYACYPYMVTCISEDKYQFEIPETQTEVAANAGPMVGYFMDDGSSPLVFKNVMSWLKVGLKGNAVVKRIVLTDKNGKKLNGKLNVTCNDTDGFSFTSSMSESEGSSKIELITEGTALSDDYKYFNFLVPVGSLANVQLQVYASDDPSAAPILDKDNLTIAHGGHSGMPENHILTAEVSSPVNIHEATVKTNLGCPSNEYVFQSNVEVTGNDDACTTYVVGLCYTQSEDVTILPTIGNCDGTQVIATQTIASGALWEGTFDVSTYGLTLGEKYRVRAYAFNGTYGYGDAVTVTIGDGPLPFNGGTFSHPFTVASGKQVYFSQGNLQYVKSTNTWQFAEHQYDIVEKKDQDVGAEYANQNIVTLFGWGTSGYNNKYPYMTSTTNSDYGNGNSNISGTNYDWGVYNAISNGGNQAGKWRTLTGGSSGNGEWDYLITKRTNAANLYGLGKVGSCTPGLIILPDDWKWEGDVAGFAASWESGPTDWSNKYSYSDWAKMEAAGAVFLPAAGYRDDTSVNNVGPDGFYWSSSYYTSYGYGAYNLSFYSGNVNPSDRNGRHGGFSVRLVSDVPSVGR